MSTRNTTQEKLADGTVRFTFTCARCDRVKHHDVLDGVGGTGYGTNQDGNPVCYECCGVVDREAMLRDGHSKTLPLYLTSKDGRRFVGNWCGTLQFPVRHYQSGRHNIAGTREDVWFIGPDHHVWHGVQYGQWTQIVHCKRTKEVV